MGSFPPINAFHPRHGLVFALVSWAVVSGADTLYEPENRLSAPLEAPNGFSIASFRVQALRVVFVNKPGCETSVLKQQTNIFCLYHSSLGGKTPHTQILCQNHLNFEVLMPLMQQTLRTHLEIVSELLNVKTDL